MEVTTGVVIYPDTSVIAVDLVLISHGVIKAKGNRAVFLVIEISVHGVFFLPGSTDCLESGFSGLLDASKPVLINGVPSEDTGRGGPVSRFRPTTKRRRDPQEAGLYYLVVGATSRGITSCKVTVG